MHRSRCGFSYVEAPLKHELLQSFFRHGLDGIRAWCRLNLNVWRYLYSFQKTFNISPAIRLFVVGFDVRSAAVRRMKRGLKVFSFTLVQLPYRFVRLNKDEWIGFDLSLPAIDYWI